MTNLLIMIMFLQKKVLAKMFALLAQNAKKQQIVTSALKQRQST
jgi:hypothetical protein